jgi:hypothetical protein
VEAREEALLTTRNAEALRSYRVAQALGLVTTGFALLAAGLVVHGRAGSAQNAGARNKPSIG